MTRFCIRELCDNAGDVITLDDQIMCWNCFMDKFVREFV